jgi:peptidoglycan/xylan/chitin deacetylase (PgdA/CDA1 family)
MIAVTVDDGPTSNMNSFIQLFNSLGIKATFFLTGVQIRKIGVAPVQAAYNAGHQIASHSNNHPDFAGLSSSQIQSEISATSSLISQAIGRTPNYFRYPYGSFTAFTNSALTSLGFHKIGWSVDSLDWESQNTQSIINEISGAFNSAANPSVDSHIFLVHEWYLQTVEALRTLVPQMKQRGFRFVTVSECLGDSGAYF